MGNKYVNYVIGIIVMIIFISLSYEGWKVSGTFGYAVNCGICITVATLLLKQLIIDLFFKSKEEYNGKRKNAKKTLEIIKKLFKKKDK